MCVCVCVHHVCVCVDVGVSCVIYNTALLDCAAIFEEDVMNVRFLQLALILIHPVFNSLSLTMLAGMKEST